MDGKSNIGKMRMESVDLISQNVKKIAELFPECVTEAADKDGNLKRLVDFDKLRQVLSGAVAEEPERYDFTWVGKRAALAEAHKPIRKTLRPYPEESRDWDATQNLYIEGDNLDVLKLLQESYLGKVKMIYIDPPYNTGNDFIYRDNFALDRGKYDEELGVYDDDNNRLFKNTDSNGRFHSDWCSMIYSRLLLARNLLKDDGVIFISIDDNEQENLKKCCDEVFGGQNFVAQLIWERAFSPKNDARFISNSHDYILMYSKNLESFTIGRLPRTEDANARYSNPDKDPRGVWMSSDISVKTYNAECDYPVTTPSGKIIKPPAGRCWSLSKNAFLERLQDNRIWFGPNGDGVPRIKRFLTELKHEGMAPTSIMFYKDVGHSQEGAKEVTKLLESGSFDGPKPVRLLLRLLTLANLKEEDIVLDFFSGSATTAHAVMQMNVEKNSRRKYIMVQLPEPCDEKGTAYKNGYKTICEIGKERIRRAGDKIKAENPLTTKDLDIGFRVLKVDSSNMNDVYYGASEVSQDLIKSAESNVKDDRTDLDLLFGCLLDWGLPLSLPYKSEEIDGVTIHDYNDGDLIACFAENVPQKAFEKVVETIAKRKPIRTVFRDSCFETDAAKINVTEIFKRYSPDARIKTI